MDKIDVCYLSVWYHNDTMISERSSSLSTAYCAGNGAPTFLSKGENGLYPVLTKGFQQPNTTAWPNPAHLTLLYPLPARNLRTDLKSTFHLATLS